jgi:hypothetical protein
LERGPSAQEIAMYQIVVKRGKKIVINETVESHDKAMEYFDLMLETFEYPRYTVDFTDLNYFRPITK